ncbi:uncharacterized protein LOC126335691 [Schistocerca gregaria]|uniref:uncharacterized protein LOC126335691 n=1 Tax=Schistocerca gregaria TaxID=7010 RepID=UPI00211EED7B|nr:uncharacterized protein LOC126335691 [Schistocerca gregaria]
MLSYMQDNWNFREWELPTVAYMLQKWVGKVYLLLTYGICTTTGLQHLKSFMGALRFTDNCVSGIVTENWKQMMGNIVFLSYCVVTTTMLVVARKDNLDMFATLILLVLVLYKSIVALQFVFLVLELRERFQSINASIRDSLPPLSVPELRAVFGVGKEQVSPQATSGRLRQLRDAYVVLMHAGETLQRHFGLPVALNIAHCVGGITFYAYGMLSPAGTRQSPYRGVSLSVLWLAHHSLRLVVTSLACAATADAAADTGPLLLRASAVCDWRSPELDAFMRLTLRGPQLRFTAAGLFVVDRRLLVSALAVVVTYLVILGQQ